MTNPTFANAAVTSLLLQNSARQLSSQVQQIPSAPLTTAEEFYVACTLSALVAILALLLAVAVSLIRDLF